MAKAIDPRTHPDEWNIAMGVGQAPLQKAVMWWLDRVNITPEKILDFGYGWGLTSALFLSLYPEAEVYCIDPVMPGVFGNENEDAVSKLPQKDKARWFYVQGKAEDELSNRREERYDLIFVDADHEYTTTLAQIVTAWPLLKEGGSMAGHDWATSPNVRAAVTAFAHLTGLEIATSPMNLDSGCVWVYERNKTGLSVGFSQEERTVILGYIIGRITRTATLSFDQAQEMAESILKTIGDCRAEGEK